MQLTTLLPVTTIALKTLLRFTKMFRRIATAKRPPWKARTVNGADHFKRQ
jgi:hypothetical protein